MPIISRWIAVASSSALVSREGLSAKADVFDDLKGEGDTKSMLATGSSGTLLQHPAVSHFWKLMNFLKWIMI